MTAWVYMRKNSFNFKGRASEHRLDMGNRPKTANSMFRLMDAILEINRKKFSIGAVEGKLLERMRKKISKRFMTGCG